MKVNRIKQSIIELNQAREAYIAAKANWRHAVDVDEDQIPFCPKQKPTVNTTIEVEEYEKYGEPDPWCTRVNNGVKNLIDQTNDAVTLARQAFAQSWVLMLMCQEDHDLMAKIGRETEDMFGKTSRTRDEIFHVLEKVRSLLNAPLIWDKAFESKV